MLIGTKVKEIAKKKGISLNQLEKDTKIATGSISKWDKISPSFEKVCNVAKALDINVDELIGEESEQVLKRTKKLLKKIAEMLYKNCDKFGLTKQDEEVKELKELIDKMGE